MPSGDTFDCRECGKMREQRQPEPFYCSVCDGGVLEAERAKHAKFVEAVRDLREATASRSRVVVLDDTDTHRFAKKHTWEWLYDDLDAILADHAPAEPE